MFSVLTQEQLHTYMYVCMNCMYASFYALKIDQIGYFHPNHDHTLLDALVPEKYVMGRWLRPASLACQPLTSLFYYCAITKDWTIV